jgi:hypothetical protein
VVLLSRPALVDQFKDYEARGEGVSRRVERFNERVAGERGARRRTSRRRSSAARPKRVGAGSGRSTGALVLRRGADLDRLIAVAAPRPPPLSVIRRRRELPRRSHYFYRTRLDLVAVPVMIAFDAPKRRGALPGGAPSSRAARVRADHRAEVNGAKRWIGVGFAQFQPPSS